MKKNMERVMKDLKIDEGMKGLLRQMWRHGYRTLHSCEHFGYISFKGKGDGWFEKNAKRLGFEKMENRECCGRIDSYANYCRCCGAGVNGVSAYENQIGIAIRNLNLKTH